MKQFLGEKITLFGGDSREVLKECPDNSIDSILTDPPYALVSIVKRFGKPGSAPAKGNEAFMRASKGFMGKTWDTGEVAFDPEFWAECLRVLKPGGHLLSFGGTRTYHRMTCAIEDAGFEIRDMMQWLYGSGFPKSHDVSKGIDKAADATRDVVGEKRSSIARKARAGGELVGVDTTGLEHLRRADITVPNTLAAQEWEGWGTALKPANEPICLARKPLSEKTVAANVLKWGTGAINIDGCRVEGRERTEYGLATAKRTQGDVYGTPSASADFDAIKGRFPANVITDGSDEVVAAFPETTSGSWNGKRTKPKSNSIYGHYNTPEVESPFAGSTGSAARFFYAAKANKRDRAGSKHPTVKPIKLLRYLARLITPPSGIILDPFAGSGTTGEAAYMEGFQSILIEREEEYRLDIEKRFMSMNNVFDRTEDETDTADTEV